MRKKIVIISFLISILLIVLIICFNIKSNKSDKSSISNNGIAIMVENEPGKYQLYTGENGQWPGEDYVVDMAQSDCNVDDIQNIDWDAKENKVLVASANSEKCILYFTKIQHDYTYTGTSQEFIAPVTGTYKIELWGASGGTGCTAVGGNGAYTVGNIKLTKGEQLFIYVGQGGESADCNAKSYAFRSSFNGGGIGTQNSWGFAASGGGATDIRLVSGNSDLFDSLKSRIMVAAGGGGGYYFGEPKVATYRDEEGGYGGQLIGGDGEMHFGGDTTNERIDKQATGGTQVSGGITNNNNAQAAGKFGIGGPAIGTSSGGGGGYYGGAGGVDQGHSPSSGAGGSSYISGYQGCVAIKKESTENSIQPKDECTEESAKNDVTCSYHFSDKIFSDTEMIAGNAEMPAPTGGTETGHTGNGYAKITLVG